MPLCAWDTASRWKNNVLPGTRATSLVKGSAIDHKQTSGQRIFKQARATRGNAVRAAGPNHKTRKRLGRRQIGRIADLDREAARRARCRMHRVNAPFRVRIAPRRSESIFSPRPIFSSTIRAVSVSSLEHRFLPHCATSAVLPARPLSVTNNSRSIPSDKQASGQFGNATGTKTYVG